MIHVARLGHSHHRMNQQIGLVLSDCPPCQLEMRPMQGIARLKGDYPLPTPLPEQRPELARGVPERTEVVVRRQFQPVDRAAEIKRSRLPQHELDARVLEAGRAIDLPSLRHTVGPPKILDFQDRQHHPFAIAQNHSRTDANLGGEGLAYVQDDRNWPERSVA